MDTLARVVSLISRRTARSEGHVFAVTPERVALAEGLRAAVAMAPMLAAAIWLGRTELALSAIAAFWICLCDPQGATSVRLRAMTRFTLLGTVVLPLAALAAKLGYLASLATLFVLVLLCGLTRSYRPTLGPMPVQGGMIASLAVVIGVASARPWDGALALGGCFLLGAAWAMLFCLFLWPIPLRHSGQLALAAIFGRLEEMAGFLLEQDGPDGPADTQAWLAFDTVHRRGVRMALERGRALASLDTAGGARLGANLDAAGRVFSALIAIGHARRRGDTAAQAQLQRLQLLLQAAGSARLDDRAARHALAAQAQALIPQAQHAADPTTRAIGFAARAMARLTPAHQPASPLPPAASPGPAGPSIDALVWRHALRVAIAAVLAFAIGTWLNVSLAYWAALAAIIVTQPISANTWLRVLERAGGSLLGGLIAALLLAHLPGPLGMSVAILPLAAAAIASRLVSYGLFVVFLCPMFMLVSDLIHPSGGLIAARFVNETIGAILGVAASFLLWPERENDLLDQAVAAAISANMQFAAATLRLGEDATARLDQLQRDAGMASTRLETTRERMLLEGRWRSPQLKRLRELIVGLRTVCGAAAVVEVLRHGQASAQDCARADACDTMCAALLQSLHTGGLAPRPESTPQDDLGLAIHNLVAAVAHYTGRASAQP